MIPAAALNYHHLRYFRSVARDGNLTRTARRLRVSQSALSAQIRQLEEALGQALFHREGRGLSLTEAGRLTLAHADEIFDAGERLLVALEHGRAVGEVLRIGAVATLSRNFQESFVKPLIAMEGVRLELGSGGREDLLARLAAHTLDVVLTNEPVTARPDAPFESRRLASQPVSLVGPHDHPPVTFPDDLEGLAIVLPSPASEIRTSFDALCAEHGVRVRRVAEVDDMAMLRLLARDSRVAALVPQVVVRDELRMGRLRELCVVPDLTETFFAVTLPRLFPHPLLARLLARRPEELLEEREGA